jgi:hypothetical protein
MIQWYPVDVDVFAKAFDQPGQQLQKLHSAGRTKTQCNKIKTTYNPEGTVAGHFLEFYFEKMK